MIFEKFLTIVFDIISSLLSFIPDIPQTPAIFNTISDTFLNIIAEGTYWITDIIGKEFFVVMLSLGVGLMLFDNVYRVTMWVIRKIPLLAIK